MPCDAACQKIIINTGFMQTLLPHIDHLWGDTLRQPIAALDNALSTLDLMMKARGLAVQPTIDFGGCEQAEELVKWIRAESCPDDAAIKLAAWTFEVWQHIEGLAAGKFPG